MINIKIIQIINTEKKMNQLKKFDLHINTVIFDTPPFEGNTENRLRGFPEKKLYSLRDLYSVSNINPT